MKMKPSDLIALKRDTVQRTMDTISNRINGLGLAESSVQQYGPRGRRLRNSGAVAGRGRSGPREGTDRHGGRARNRRSEGRAISEPRSRPGAARRRAAAQQQAGGGQTARRHAGGRMVPGGPAPGGDGERNAQRASGPGENFKSGKPISHFLRMPAGVSASSPKTHQQ